uniref:Uncharacterized protein n=1 Tax=Anabaena sp. XPORK13A TaxID=1634053 RepID=A0A0U3BX23_9NOST|nr:hypothetical protein [Anabaena sp. XPORK13A]
MKPSLETDFTVAVRHQIWEELPEVADLYQGIYSVTLNFLVSITFIPEVEKNLDNWPPLLPENLDCVSTKLEARLFTLALSDYTVTPNSLLAGEQELIPIPSYSQDIEDLNTTSRMGIIFYVKPEEFETFSQELSEVSEKTMGVHDYVRISEIQTLKFAQFILSKIICSPNLSGEDSLILKCR